jgi:hypothetical protein
MNLTYESARTVLDADAAAPCVVVQSAPDALHCAPEKQSLPHYCVQSKSSLRPLLCHIRASVVKIDFHIEQPPNVLQLGCLQPESMRNFLPRDICCLRLGRVSITLDACLTEEMNKTGETS